MGLTYANLEVCVQQELKFKAALTLIAHIYDRLQAILRKSHAVYQTEVERPCLLCVVRKTRGVKPEVELDGGRVEGVF